MFERSEKQSEKVLCTKMIQDLQQSTVGLNNLKFTYISDTKFCCDMDTILETVLARLDKYTKHEEILITSEVSNK